MKRLIELGRAVWATWTATRAGRALHRYDTANGSVLSGGMAYAALFSLFAALAIGYTVFVRVLGGDNDLRVAVLAEVDSWVPGLVDTGHGGVLTPTDLVLSTGLSWTSVIAAGVLLWSATGFMGALRTSVRAMFGLTESVGNPVTERLRQLLGFVVLSAAVLLSAGASVAASAAVPWVLESLGLDGGAVSVAVRVGGIVVTLALDAAVVAAVVRYVGGVRVPLRDLLTGAVAVGVVSGALRYLGTEVIASAANRNALLASFAVVVTVLLLVNILARVLLLASAWMADPPAAANGDDKEQDEQEQDEPADEDKNEGKKNGAA
ncbi:YihY/virulence factor BrkB family protein [Promicromonospora sukumoe]|uniref:Membrane protein n=1 Tax=Promicromonospora sukumoe TaxID=88382 RepID=A0A7W3PC20_9MICO|nr:YhjD/YihY/BrkB family envelope integrity protein [Promicromonospora sukumoe]MBA8806278.1 membrane protein [Promicromonospora sukumoe]